MTKHLNNHTHDKVLSLPDSGDIAPWEVAQKAVAINWTLPIADCVLNVSITCNIGDGPLSTADVVEALRIFGLRLDRIHDLVGLLAEGP